MCKTIIIILRIIFIYFQIFINKVYTFCNVTNDRITHRKSINYCRTIKILSWKWNENLHVYILLLFRYQTNDIILMTENQSQYCCRKDQYLILHSFLFYARKGYWLLLFPALDLCLNVWLIEFQLQCLSSLIKMYGTVFASDYTSLLLSAAWSLCPLCDVLSRVLTILPEEPVKTIYTKTVSKLVPECHREFYQVTRAILETDRCAFKIRTSSLIAIGRTSLGRVVCYKF